MESSLYKEMTAVLEPFDDEEKIVPYVHLEVGGALIPGGESEILPRLLRAALDQSCSDPAAFSR